MQDHSRFDHVLSHIHNNKKSEPAFRAKRPTRRARQGYRQPSGQSLAEKYARFFRD